MHRERLHNEIAENEKGLGYLLYYIFKWNWCIVMGAVTFAFWFGPFTPFFPLCIAITLFIKKIMQVKKRKKGEQNYER